MKLAMDEVSFERGGTEVHMRKGRRAAQDSNNESFPSVRRRGQTC
jgi:hypothetical protein